jgi:hypothetical protein
VQKCQLPPPLELGTVKDTTVGCPNDLWCLDMSNAKTLLLRESLMKRWIQDALLACKKE